MNILRFLETTWQDLRYGFRLIGRNRTFAAVAILTLALGTGANAAIFQLVNAVRLRALSVDRPQELVTIGINTNDKGRTGRFMSRRPFFSEPLWHALRSQQQGFSSVFAWGVTTWNIGTDGEYRPAQGLYVSGNFFHALGVTAQTGRLFTDADDQNGCASPGAVLTHGFWQSRYAGQRLTSSVSRSCSTDAHSKFWASRRRDSSASRSAGHSTSRSRSVRSR
jgi:putative ABC transport system permease protein